MSAVVVYLAEVNEVTHLEVAQYTIEQFLSDVGGAAGLFMGMSLATVLGTCDFIFLMVYESVQKTDFYKRIRDIITGSQIGNTPAMNRKWTSAIFLKGLCIGLIYRLFYYQPEIHKWKLSGSQNIWIYNLV